MYFDAAELEVHAMTPAPKGGLFVATSPDGKIYRVDRAGAATVFFDPEDQYIWSLATDSDGNLFAATGDKGIVYKIDPSGKGELFYRTKATHVTAIGLDSSGNLLVGTESPGRLLRVDRQGRGFLLLDTPFDEIRTLRFDDKGFSTRLPSTDARRGGGPPPSGGDERPPERPPDPSRPPIPTVTTEVTSVVLADSPSSSGSQGSTREDYRAVARRHLPRRPGRFVGPALGVARRHPLRHRDRPRRPPDCRDRQQGQAVPARRRSAPAGPPRARRGAAGHGAPSRRRRARSTTRPRTRESYCDSAPTWPPRAPTSRRCATPRWWRAGGTSAGADPYLNGARIELFTRSGNTETPDDTWSPWSSAYTDADGSPITSPKARYLQWRAVLSGRGQSPVLTSVSAAYLQRNSRPQVRSITVHPPGIVFQKPFSIGDPDLAGFDNQTTPDRKLAAVAARRAADRPLARAPRYEKGLQTLAWRADDENGDELRATTSSTGARASRRGRTLRASCQRHHPCLGHDHGAERHLLRPRSSRPTRRRTARTRRSSANSTAPRSTSTTARPSFRSRQRATWTARTIVTFDVVDDYSPIERVEYSRDGQQWWAVFPRDGIADSKTNATRWPSKECSVRAG